MNQLSFYLFLSSPNIHKQVQHIKRLVIYLTTVFQPKHDDNILYFCEGFVSYSAEGQAIDGYCKEEKTFDSTDRKSESSAT